MNQRELLFAIKFRTQSSAAIKKAAKDIKGAAAAAKVAEVNTKKAAVGARSMGAAFTAAGARLRAFGVKARTSFSRLRTEIFRAQTALFALGVAFGLTAVIMQLKNFELAMAKVRAIASKGNEILAKTSAQFIVLTATARRLGETTQFTATQVADGLRLLAQAGFSANEAVDAIEGTLSLAIAASTDLGTATTITANSIRAFNLQAKEATRVADVLTAATQNSNTTIELLGEALKFSAPAALAAGQSIETTAAALSVLADAGLKGTLAGTGLRRVIVGLLNPVTKAKTAFKALRIDIRDLVPGARDAEGSIRTLDDIIRTLADSAFGAREAFAAFGLRGGPAALVLVNIERVKQRFTDLSVVIKDSEGRAKKFQETITDTLFGSMKLLNSRIESLALSQGNFAMAVRDTIKFMADVVAGLNRTLYIITPTQKASQRLAETLRDVGKAIAWLIKNLPFLIAVFIGTKVALFALTAQMAYTAGGAAALWLALAPIAAVLIGIGLAAGGIGLAKYIIQQRDAAKEAAQLAIETERWEKTLKAAKKTIFDLKKEMTGDERLALMTLLDIQATDALNQIAVATARMVGLRKELSEFVDVEDRVIGKGKRRQVVHGNAEKKKALEEQVKVAEDILALRQEEARFLIVANISEQTKAEILGTQKQTMEEMARLTVDVQQSLQAAIGNSAAQGERDIAKLTRQVKIASLEATGLKSKLDEAEDLKFQESIGLFDNQTKENLQNFIAAYTKIAKQQTDIATGLREQAELEGANRADLEIRALIHEDMAKVVKEQGILEAQLALDAENLRDADRERLSRDKRRYGLAAKESARQKAANAELLKFRQGQISELKDEIRYQNLSNDAKRRAELGIELVNQAFKKGIPIQDEWLERLNAQITAVEEFEKASNTLAQGWRDASDKMIEDMKDFRTQGAEIFENMFDDLNDKLLDFVETGKFNAQEFFGNVRREFLKLGIKQITGRILEGIRGKKEDPAEVAAKLIVDQLKDHRDALKEQIASVQDKDTELIKQQLIAVNQTLEAMARASGVDPKGTSTDVPAGSKGDTGFGALPEHKAKGSKGGLASILAPLSGIEGALPPGFSLADNVPGGAGIDALLTGLPKLASMLPPGITGATSGIMPTAGTEEDNCCKMIVAEIVIQKTVLGVKLDEIKQAILVSGGAAGPLQDKVSMLSNPGIPAGDGSGKALATVTDTIGGLFNQTSNVLGAIRAENGGVTSLPRLASGTSRAASLGTGALSKLGLGANEIPAVLHPNEAVIPLTRGGLIPIGPGGDVALPFGRKIGTEFGGPLTDMGMRTALTGRKTPVGLAAGLGATRAAYKMFGKAPRGVDGFKVTDAGIVTESGLTFPVKPGGGVDMSSMFELFGEEDFEGFSELVQAGSGAGGFFSAITGGVSSILGSIGSGIGALDSIGTNGAGGNISSAISIVGSIVSIVDAVMKGTKKPKQKTKRLRTLGFGDFLSDGDKKRGFTKEEHSYFAQERNAQIAARNRGARREGAKIAERRFAEGGIVNRPTSALIGEAGVPEAVVPLPNGRAIPVQLGGAGGQQPVSEVMNVTYNIMTPDADSFRSAQPQIMSATNEELRRASNRSLDDDQRGA